eukprot:Colp12_sorted_trinity150504_noHs@6726
MAAVVAPAPAHEAHGFLSRVSAFPYVSDSLHYLKGVHDKLIAMSPEIVRTNIELAEKYTTEAVHKITEQYAEPLSKVDAFACQQLDKIQALPSSFTIINEQLAVRVTSFTSKLPVEEAKKFVKTAQEKPSDFLMQVSNSSKVVLVSIYNYSQAKIAQVLPLIQHSVDKLVPAETLHTIQQNVEKITVTIHSTVSQLASRAGSRVATPDNTPPATPTQTSMDDLKADE